MTAFGAVALAALPELRTLDLSNTAVDDGLAPLLIAAPELTTLELKNTRVTDAIWKAPRRKGLRLHLGGPSLRSVRLTRFDAERKPGSVRLRFEVALDDPVARGGVVELDAWGLPRREIVCRDARLRFDETLPATEPANDVSISYDLPKPFNGWIDLGTHPLPAP